MGRLIEGFWDCQYCSTKGIAGKERECPNCGNVRNIDTRFYPKAEKKYVPEELAKNISRNPDWICLSCQCLNPDASAKCLSCGAERTAENKTYLENKEEKEEMNNSLLEKDDNDGEVEEDDAEEGSNEDNEIPEKQSLNSCSERRFGWIKEIDFGNIKNKIIPLSIAVLIIGLICGGIYLFMPKQKEISINQISWNRIIEIEKSNTFEESNWNMPPNGKLEYTMEEIYGYEQQIDHYETRTRMVAKQRISGYQEVVVGMRDLGNGYFEEITNQIPIYETYYEEETYEEPIYISVPIYKTKYYYKIDRWIYNRSVKTEGLDTNPYWGEINLQDLEREGKKIEKYLITGQDLKGKQIEVSLPIEQWKKLKIDQTIKVKVHITGNGEVIN